MRVVFLIEGHNGCALYRLQIPAKYLIRKGVDVVVAEGLTDQIINDADIIVFQKANSAALLELFRECKRRGKKVVYECDDDYFNIPLWNPAHLYYAQIKNLLPAFLKEADLLTLSTDHLAGQFSKFSNRSVVLPNSIDFEEVDQWKDGERFISALDKECNRLTLAELRQRTEGKVVVGWFGSPTHKKDLNILVRVLGRLANTHPNVVFLFGGCITAEIARTIPKGQLFFLEMVPPVAYIRYLKAVGLDIGLAPLDGHIFNNSKSNLKVVEYMAIGAVPVATNNVENYGRTIQHGASGFLCGNEGEWFEHLSRLISDHNLRAQMKSAAGQHVRTHWDIDKNAQMWTRAYSQLLGA